MKYRLFSNPLGQRHDSKSTRLRVELIHCIYLLYHMYISITLMYLQLHTSSGCFCCWTFFENTRLTHWGRVTHICAGKLTNIGSDNDLSPGRRQAIIWTNAGKLLIEPLGTNFSETLIGIQSFSFKKMRLKMSSAKWRPFCLGLNVLNSVAIGLLCIVFTFPARILYSGVLGFWFVVLAVLGVVD